MEIIKSYEEINELILVDLKMPGIEPVKVSDVADVFISDNSLDIYAKIIKIPNIRSTTPTTVSTSPLSPELL